MSELKSKPKRTWDVLLIGGASGTGKTSISYRLAQHFGVGITEVDDFFEMLLHTTTPEQQPALHYWETHPEAIHLSAEQIVEQGWDVRAALYPGLEAVIANHLETQTPIVLEGDFIQPALAAQNTFGEEANAGRVKGVFLIEPDEAQLVRNFLLREPEAGEQTTRARVSWLQNQWYTAEAARVSVPTVTARPWADVFERVLKAIQ